MGSLRCLLWQHVWHPMKRDTGLAKNLFRFVCTISQKCKRSFHPIQNLVLRTENKSWGEAWHFKCLLEAESNGIYEGRVNLELLGVDERVQNVMLGLIKLISKLLLWTVWAAVNGDFQSTGALSSSYEEMLVKGESRLRIWGFLKFGIGRIFKLSLSPISCFPHFHFLSPLFFVKFFSSTSFSLIFIWNSSVLVSFIPKT